MFVRCLLSAQTTEIEEFFQTYCLFLIDSLRRIGSTMTANSPEEYNFVDGRSMIKVVLRMGTLHSKHVVCLSSLHSYYQGYW